jgi:hypothetical protein
VGWHYNHAERCFQRALKPCCSCFTVRWYNYVRAYLECKTTLKNFSDQHFSTARWKLRACCKVVSSAFLCVSKPRCRYYSRILQHAVNHFIVLYSHGLSSFSESEHFVWAFKACWKTAVTVGMCWSVHWMFFGAFFEFMPEPAILDNYENFWIANPGFQPGEFLTKPKTTTKSIQRHAPCYPTYKRKGGGGDSESINWITNENWTIPSPPSQGIKYNQSMHP